jgi:hypothetical protein
VIEAKEDDDRQHDGEEEILLLVHAFSVGLAVQVMGMAAAR